jgi:hypothetical protein
MSNGSWSPDGRYFVLSEAVFYKDEYSDMLLIDANGTMQRSFWGEPYISALGWSPCYRSLSTKLSTPFSIKQFDGNAISLGKTPLRSVTSSLSMEFIQILSQCRFV